ncbi:MAG: cysteine desulfurase [Rhodocyclaceae bacterium]|nr:cysteine desulfurase [Rhodocyclaceae bacterium]
MFAPAYLDHNATTPLDAGVLEAMLPFLKERYGNPSSRHEYGRAARAAIDAARQQVAAAVGAHPTEVVFASGGSEANNLFIKGAAACLEPGTVAVSAIEHPCVREPANDLKRLGWSVHEIAVDAEGRVAETDFSAALAKRPALVSVMLANNETGVLQDIPALASQARTAKAWFHTDAVQALGKVAIDFRALNAAGVNALTISSHKIYGPKGAAALVLDKRIELRPLVSGGGQERNLRSGTENVAAIVGFGAACELAVARLEAEAARLNELRGQLEEGLTAFGATVFSRNAPRLPNTAFFALGGIDGETLVAQLDRAGFAVASGSACSSVSPEPSHTLLAMGVEAGMAKGALRLSLGRANTEEDVARFLQALGETMRKLKGLAAVAA